jgi:hypothetical protein
MHFFSGLRRGDFRYTTIRLHYITLMIDSSSVGGGRVAVAAVTVVEVGIGDLYGRRGPLFRRGVNNMRSGPHGGECRIDRNNHFSTGF